MRNHKDTFEPIRIQNTYMVKPTVPKIKREKKNNIWHPRMLRKIRCSGFYDTECGFKTHARNIPEDPLGQGLFPGPKTQLRRETGFLLSLNLVASDDLVASDE